MARAAVFFVGVGAVAGALVGAFAFGGRDFAAAALRAGGFVSGLLLAMVFTPCEWQVSHPNG
ncbi:hypothetical protein ASE31_29590 [Acidovorax sp. Root217]|nr:hypothetical protein ASE31_29590 [Acidovorax sp. Root217]